MNNNNTETVESNRAVSPVIGVILMVALTVVLAGVIGTFILDMGGQLSSGPPDASFTTDYQDGNATVTYTGGETVNATQTPVYVMGSDSGRLCAFSGTIQPGDNCTAGYSSGETVRVVWVAGDGQVTATLHSSEAPE